MSSNTSTAYVQKDLEKFLLLLFIFLFQEEVQVCPDRLQDHPRIPGRKQIEWKFQQVRRGHRSLKVKCGSIDFPVTEVERDEAVEAILAGKGGPVLGIIVIGEHEILVTENILDLLYDPLPTFGVA